MVHYRWHPYHGRRIKVHYREQRAGGCFVHVEIEAGIVAALPAWMLDASICAAMTLGGPQLSTAALCDLHRLLLVRGFRRSSGGVPSAIQEPQDVPSVQGSQEPDRVPVPQQRAMAFESRLTRSLVNQERSKVIRQLAHLLMLAAGVRLEESDRER